MSELTEKDINEAAMGDYRAVAGRVVLLEEVECYDDRGDSVTVTCDPPAIARIGVHTEREQRENVTRWTDGDYCDPVYNVEILERHPAFVGVRPSWVYGTCRSLKGNVEAARFAAAQPDIQERYKDVAALPYETGACAPEGDAPASAVTLK